MAVLDGTPLLCASCSKNAAIQTLLRTSLGEEGSRLRGGWGSETGPVKERPHTHCMRDTLATTTPAFHLPSNCKNDSDNSGVPFYHEP